MRLMHQILISLMLSTVSAHNVRAYGIEGTSFFSPRSQSINSARDSSGTNRYRIYTDDKPAQSFIAFTPYYAHSVRSKRIADALFGTDTLTISGSMVAKRSDTDILADYFGLSPFFKSSVHCKPSIQNALLAINGYWTLDRWVDGAYVSILAPVGATQWYIELQEEIVQKGETMPFPAHYMAENPIQAPIDSFTQALTGNVRFGDMQDPIAFGKLSPCPLSYRGLSDVIITFGWNCIQRDYGHLGFGLRTVLPSGSRPKSTFLFAPLLGNGKHLELGLSLDGHLLLWEKDGNQDFSIYGQAHITHMFKSRQRRSFDLLCNGPLSRYLLLKNFDTQRIYNRSLTPAINQVTLPCTVQMAIQTEILVMFEYTYNAWLIDLGYNGFIRSREKVQIKDTSIPTFTFGIKGIQNVTTPLGTPDNSTQSTATIYGNTLDQQNKTADMASPVFVQEGDIDMQSAGSPRIITHKLFMHLSYTWNHTRCQSFFGLGAEIEFEGINPRNNTQSVHDTVSLAGFWLKGGISF